MYIEKHIPHRRPNEKMVLFVRRHWLALLKPWVFDLFLACIPIGIYFFLTNFQSQLLANQAVYMFLFLLGSLYYLFLVLFFFNAFIDYYLDLWIVTDQRIINIEQKGLFNREIAEHGLDKIQDVTGTQKGVFPTFFSYGDVHIQTAGEVQRFIFHQVDNPFEVAKIINDLIQKKEAKFESQLSEKINPAE